MTEEKLKLTLLKEKDPKLTEPCTTWDFTRDGDPKELVLAMGKVMMDPNRPGIGLSANQVGIQKNILKGSAFCMFSPVVSFKTLLSSLTQERAIFVGSFGLILTSGMTQSHSKL